MKRILLVCAAGMSTSLLVTKMEAAAKNKGIESKIWAVSADAARDNMKEADVLLIGPQVRYMLKELQAEGEKVGVPVDAIAPVYYGMMNGEKVLEQALTMIENK